MAGIVGICGSGLGDVKESLQKAVEATVYSGKVVFDPHFSNNNFHLAKSYFNFTANQRMHASEDEVYVWIDGEIYNQHEITESPNAVFADTLLQWYMNDQIVSKLLLVDGVFVAILYDSKKNILQIITDRYGLKPFFLYHKNNKLIFAAELKCFLSFMDFSLQIRKDVVDCFVELGHMMGNETWFEDVEFLEPASIYSYFIQSDTLSKKRYWTWADEFFFA